MSDPVDRWVGERTGLGERLTAETLLDWQLGQVREVLTRVRARSRFFGKRLREVDPASIASLADLQRLPFCSAVDVASDPLSFLCVPQAEVARVTTLTTSGTQGVKKRIFFTARDLEHTVDFFAVGMQELVERGQSVLILMPGASESSIGRLLQTALARIGVDSTIGDARWTAMEAIDAARGRDCIVGIPQEVLYMCRTEPGLRPKTVLLSADFAPRCVVQELERAWRCRVFTHYGMTETGFGGAVQCSSREGHHLRAADLLIEIVEPATGRPVSDGHMGEIVLTTLRNEAMPLIRYRTGDLGSLVTGPCACGGSLPRLGRVEGRKDNEVPVPGGGAVSIHRLDEVLFAIPGVRGFEAALDLEGEALLTVTVDGDEAIAPQRLRDVVPPGVGIRIGYGEVNPFANRSKRTLRTGAPRPKDSP